MKVIREKKEANYNPILVKFLFGITGIILFIFLWEIVLRLFLLQPNFSQFKGFLPLFTLKALISLTIEKFFWISIFASLRRVIIGLFFASMFGIPVGLLVGAFRYLRDITNAPFQFVRMISPISWMPIALIFLPGFEEAILFLIFIVTVWPILLNTSHGVINANPDWIKMARNQGASERQLLFRIIFPASIPYMVTGFRLGIGVAWIILVPAEMIGTSSGLGYLINDARDTMEYDKLMAAVIAIGIIGFCIDSLFQVVKRKFEWKPRKELFRR
ncbi:Bicarbonate transport system permease protein CmpB [subsurface metagenome]